MTAEGINRKLTAILSADAVGYSRLMSADEVGTVQKLKTYRELIGVRVREHHGRVVDSPGDNLLAEFPSTLDAVRSAVEIQRVLKMRNDDLPDDRRMEFRIGIHLGDVMVESDRIYGDGVNIAARLEGLADPEGICISATVHEQVQNKLDIEFEDTGLQDVKNIPQPVRVYKIQTALHVSTEAKKEKAPPTVDKKPCIAVLPFVNMSDDPQQEYFSDGISEDILNGLAKIQGLDVIARTSSFHFKGQNLDIREISRQLNATHILEGSVRKSANRIRVTAQLVSADKGTHLWSEQYNRELTDVFEVQDEIADAILKELNIRLSSLSGKHMPTTNMEAYNAFLLGRYLFYNGQYDEAIIELEKAALLDPRNADVYGLLAWAHNAYMFFGLNPVQEKWSIIREYTNKALSLDFLQHDALITGLIIRFYADNAYQDIINELADLVRKDPNNTRLLWAYGVILRIIGRLNLALRVLDRATEFDPLWPFIYNARGWTFCQARRYDEARKSFEREEILGSSLPAELAYLSICEGDLEALQKQLDRGESNWGYTSHFYPMYKAAASYLRGDNKKIKETLAPRWQTTDYLSFIEKSLLAALEGDLNLALDYYEQAFSESDYQAFFFIHMPFWHGKIFPNYRSHPRFQKMLKEVRLDDESLDKLKIPSLPF